jgi:hypothetical protein
VSCDLLDVSVAGLVMSINHELHQLYCQRLLAYRTDVVRGGPRERRPENLNYPPPSSANRQLTVPGLPADGIAAGQPLTRSVDRQDSSASVWNRGGRCWTDTRQTRSLETASRVPLGDSARSFDNTSQYQQPQHARPPAAVTTAGERRTLPAIPQAVAATVASASKQPEILSADMRPVTPTRSRRQLYGMAAITNRGQQNNKKQLQQSGQSTSEAARDVGMVSTSSTLMVVTSASASRPSGDNSFDSVPTDYDASDTSRSRSGDPVTTTSIESSSSVPGCGTTATAGGFGSSSTGGGAGGGMASNNCSVDTEDSTDKSGGTSGGHRLHQMRDDSGYKSLETQQSLGKAAAAGVVTAAAWVARIRSRSVDGRDHGGDMNTPGRVTSLDASFNTRLTPASACKSLEERAQFYGLPTKFLGDAHLSVDATPSGPSTKVVDNPVAFVRRCETTSPATFGSNSLFTPMTKLGGQSLSALFSRPVRSKSDERAPSVDANTSIAAATCNQGRRTTSDSSSPQTDFGFFEKFAMQTHTVGRVLTSGFDRIRQQAGSILSKTTSSGTGSMSGDSSPASVALGDKSFTGLSIEKTNDKVPLVQVVTVDDRGRSASLMASNLENEIVSCSNARSKSDAGSSSSRYAAVANFESASFNVCSSGAPVSPRVPRSALRTSGNPGSATTTSKSPSSNRQPKEVDFVMVHISAERGTARRESKGSHVSSTVCGDSSVSGRNSGGATSSGRATTTIRDCHVTQPIATSRMDRPLVSTDAASTLPTKAAYGGRASNDPSADFRRGSAKTASKKRREYRSRKQVEEVNDSIGPPAATGGAGTDQVRRQASSSSTSQTTTSTGSASGCTGGEPSSSDNSLEHSTLGNAMLGGSITSEGSSSASCGGGTDADAQEEPGARVSQRRRQTLATSGRDYSIDAKTDALFNEFLKYDPNLDGGTRCTAGSGYQRVRRQSSSSISSTTFDTPAVRRQKTCDCSRDAGCSGGSGSGYNGSGSVVHASSRRPAAPIRSRSASLNESSSTLAGRSSASSSSSSKQQRDVRDNSLQSSTHFGSSGKLRCSIEEEDENNGD